MYKVALCIMGPNKCDSPVQFMLFCVFDRTILGSGV